MHHIEDFLEKFNINLCKEAHVDKMKMKLQLQSLKSELNTNTHRPRVSFSEMSIVNTYEDYRGGLHRRNMAYSSKDRDIFQIEATQEADHIKVLIITAPQQSRADSVKHLLKNNIVSREELVGIEHMALEDSNRSDIRKRHSMAVLRKQQEQRQQQHQGYGYVSLRLRDPAIALGKFARKNSLESRNRARARAALSSEQQYSGTKAAAALGCYVL